MTKPYWLKNLFYRVLVVLMLHGVLFGLEKREHPVSMRVSLLVPCHSSHFVFLKDLLVCYNQMPNRPIEVVVSLSGTAGIDPKAIQKLETYPWRFVLKILQQNRERSAVSNRNLAAIASSGDLLICQDADDLPHSQRIQMIQHLFENYQIDFLLHRFSHEEREMRIPISVDRAARCCHDLKTIDGLRDVAQGVPAFTRAVFQRVQWETRADSDEDCLFNYTVFRLFENTVFCSLPLYCYRSQYSAPKVLL